MDNEMLAEVPARSEMEGIYLSQSAADQIRKLLAARGKGLGIRIGLKRSGCLGWSYSMEFVDASEVSDLKFESRGVSLYVEASSVPYLRGVSVDYVKKGFSEGFTFSSPNSKQSCHCGKSVAY